MHVQVCTKWKTLKYLGIIDTLGVQRCDYLSCSLRVEQDGERMSTGSRGKFYSQEVESISRIGENAQ